MRPGETSGRLALNSSDLGSFQYDLILKATPARPEKPLSFSAMLGSSQSLVAKIVNYTRQKTEYSTKVSWQGGPRPVPAAGRSGGGGGVRSEANAPLLSPRRSTARTSKPRRSSARPRAPRRAPRWAWR